MPAGFNDPLPDDALRDFDGGVKILLDACD